MAKNDVYINCRCKKQKLKINLKNNTLVEMGKKKKNEVENFRLRDK